MTYCLARFLLTVVIFIAGISACTQEDVTRTVGTVYTSGTMRVTGEVHSANSRKFGRPSIPNIWQYTIAFMVDDGSRVLAGQEVLRFDTQELQTQVLVKSNELNEKAKELQKQNIVTREKLAELRLLVQEARAEMHKAALKADIPEELLARRDYRENQLLLKQARLTLALREAEVEREEVVLQTESEILQREITVLKAEIKELRGSIDAMSIKAPTDGVVIHSVDQHGNKMAVGDNVWGGQRVIEFPDLAKLELRLEIAERDSARVAVGQPVSFNLDAAPDHEYHGRITELASVVRTKSVNQPTRVFDATAALLDPNPELMRPGMSVTAEIHPPHVQEAGL